MNYFSMDRAHAGHELTAIEAAGFRGQPVHSMRFGDVLTQLKVAMGHGHTWLHDFRNDDVMISGDLYEVLQAFARMHGTSQQPAVED